MSFYFSKKNLKVMFNKIQKIRLTLMSVVVASVMMLVSCDKNGLAPETNGTKPSSAKISAGIVATTDVPVPKFDGKMYVFDTEDAFLQVRQQLEDSYTANIKSYVGALSAKGLTEDEMDMAAYNEKFDFAKPVTDFDSKVAGFVSAREVIEPSYQKWLQNDVLDFSTNPYDKIGADQFTAALLNANSEVMIGGKIINFLVQRLKICVPSNTNRSGSWYSGSKFRIFGDLHVNYIAVSATTYPQWKIFGTWLPSLRSVCASTSGVGYGLFCKQKDASTAEKCFYGFTGVIKFFPGISVRPGELSSSHSCPSKGVYGSLSI
jgi:hypothetical protein